MLRLWFETCTVKATASRNAYKGGHWLMLRELSRAINAEIQAARDLVNTAKA